MAQRWVRQAYFFLVWSWPRRAVDATLEGILPLTAERRGQRLCRRRVYSLGGTVNEGGRVMTRILHLAALSALALALARLMSHPAP